MAKIWSENQKKALQAKGMNLVVSAAAGSGKTSVLTARLIGLLSEPDGVDVERLAVVTFTRAAAAELSSRLYDGLSEALAKDPENRHLARQLFRLPGAQISTIHSFAFQLIRRFRKELGLPEKLRIADPAETAPLATAAAEEALEEFLADPDKRGPRYTLCRLLGSARNNDGVLEHALALLEKCGAYPKGIDALREEAARLRREGEGATDFLDTRAGQILSERFQKKLRYHGALLSYLGRGLEEYPFVGLYCTVFSARGEALRQCAEALSRRALSEAQEIFDRAFEKNLPQIRGLTDEEEAALKKSLQDLHNRKIKTPLKEELHYLARCGESFAEEALESAALCEELFVLMEGIDRRFTQAKRERGLVDYKDLERLTLRLVAEERDGEFVPTALARSLSEELQAVFVDEYQDTNRVQDLIFRCLSSGSNLFFVGDPKQSIYRFRGAEPSIFSRYKNKLGDYDPACTDGKPKKIFLSENYRSDKSVIDLVNRVFRIMMDGRRDDSLYQKNDELRHAKVSSLPVTEQEAELIFAVPEEGSCTVWADEPEEAAEAMEENGEAAVIAERIRSILLGEILRDDETRFEPKDIAVICRKNSQLAPVRAALRHRGIPCTVGPEEDVKESREYLFVTSFLRALDNPDRDVPLLATLSSPLFRFSSDELYRIRKLKRKVPFYTALCLAAEGEGEYAGRCRDFLEIFTQWRKKSREMSFSAFLFHLYHSLGIGEIYAAAGGAELFPALIAAARRAEAADAVTLSDFLGFLERQDMESADTARVGVSLMTIHGSKGLQFPIVFVSFLSGRFNREDESKPLVLSTRLGVVPLLPREEGRLRYRSPYVRAAAVDLRWESLEEDKRVLYVAMTRAEKKLILTGSLRDPKSLATALFTFCRERPDLDFAVQSVNEASCPMELILPCLSDDPALQQCAVTMKEGRREGLRVIMMTPSEASAVPTELPAATDEKGAEESFSVEELLPYLNFRYEEQEDELLPKKLSVSEILSQAREEDEEPALFLTPLRELKDGRLRPSAAARGTAMHEAVQFMDLARGEADLEGELSRLVAEGYLAPDTAELVDRETLASFFRSPLYAEVKKSPYVVHEKRFNVLLPARTFLDREGEVMVQGVVDLYFENADGTLTLVDFKTDRVKEKDGEAILRERHGAQLRLYRPCVEAFEGKRVTRLCLYSFALHRTVELPLE